MGERTVTFVRLLDEGADDEMVSQARSDLLRVALEESPVQPNVDVLRGGNLVEALLGYIGEGDLVVMGLQRVTRRQSAFGPLAAELALRTHFPLILISRHA
jgi:hypothetical protein